MTNTAHSLSAVLWCDWEPEGWADCIYGLANFPHISRICVGGHGRLTVLRDFSKLAADPKAASKVKSSETPSFARMVAAEFSLTASNVLVMSAPYSFDDGMCIRAGYWLRFDRRFSTVTFWEIANHPRALSRAVLPTHADLSAVSRQLERHLAKLEPVPISAVHNGVAVLGRSAMEVEQGLDPSLDTDPCLSIMEFSVRAQRRGFIPVLDPISVCRPLQDNLSLGNYERVSKSLGERFTFMPEHLLHETMSPASPFSIARLLATRALEGLSLAVKQQPGHKLSCLLLELLQTAAHNSSIRHLLIVTGEPITSLDLNLVPGSLKITLLPSFDLFRGQIDILFKGLGSVVPPEIERSAERVVLELYSDQSRELASVGTLSGRAPDAILVDNLHLMHVLQEKGEQTSLDRVHFLDGGFGLVRGPRRSAGRKIPFNAYFAAASFALCIAPGYNGDVIDSALQALSDTGLRLTLIVIDTLEGPDELSSQIERPLIGPVLILPLLSAGEREWCHAHAAMVFGNDPSEPPAMDEHATSRLIDFCFDTLAKQSRSQ